MNHNAKQKLCRLCVIAQQNGDFESKIGRQSNAAPRELFFYWICPMSDYNRFCQKTRHLAG